MKEALNSTQERGQLLLPLQDDDLSGMIDDKTIDFAEGLMS